MSLNEETSLVANVNAASSTYEVERHVDVDVAMKPVRISFCREERWEEEAYDEYHFYVEDGKDMYHVEYWRQNFHRTDHVCETMADAITYIRDMDPKIGSYTDGGRVKDYHIVYTMTIGDTEQFIPLWNDPEGDKERAISILHANIGDHTMPV